MKSSHSRFGDRVEGPAGAGPDPGSSPDPGSGPDPGSSPDPGSGPDPGSETGRVSPGVGAPWRELARAHRLLRRAGAALDRAAEEEGWPALRFPLRCLLLAHLGEATAFGLTPIRLARLVRLQPSSLAHHLDVLQRAELITRHPQWIHDRRKVAVRLTERGRYALRRLGSVLETPTR